MLALALQSCATSEVANVPAAAATPQERLAAMRPVSAAMLQNPAPGDWLQWGRTYDGQNFSPLKRITRENVKTLAPAWRDADPGRAQHADAAGPRRRDVPAYRAGHGAGAGRRNRDRAVAPCAYAVGRQFKHEDGAGAVRRTGVRADLRPARDRTRCAHRRRRRGTTPSNSARRRPIARSSTCAARRLWSATR